MTLCTTLCPVALYIVTSRAIIVDEEMGPRIVYTFLLAICLWTFFSLPPRPSFLCVSGGGPAFIGSRRLISFRQHSLNHGVFIRKRWVEVPLDSEDEWDVVSRLAFHLKVPLDK